MTITINQARAIIRGAFAHQVDAELKPLCVAVLDSGGHLVAFEREDGGANGCFQFSFAKAHGAITVGVNSRTLGQMAEERPHVVSCVATAIGGALIPSAGGVIILDDGLRVGVVGVSGDTSDNDEAAAIAGIESCGLQPAER